MKLLLYDVKIWNQNACICKEKENVQTNRMISADLPPGFTGEWVGHEP